MSKEKEGGMIADQIFESIAALNSNHGPVLGRLVRCLGFLVLYILWLRLNWGDKEGTAGTVGEGSGAPCTPA